MFSFLVSRDRDGFPGWDPLRARPRVRLARTKVNGPAAAKRNTGWAASFVGESSGDKMRFQLSLGIAVEAVTDRVCLDFGFFRLGAECRDRCE